MAGKPYEPMIDVSRAAEMMGISPQEVRAMVYAGQLRAITFAGTQGSLAYRFRPSEVEAAMRRPRAGHEWGMMTNWTPPAQIEPELTIGGRRLIVIDLAQARVLHDRGMGDAEIGREFGASARMVAHALRTGQCEFLSGPGRLSVQFDVARAIELRRAGKTFAEIAEEIGGVSGATIGNAVRGVAPELENPLGFRDHDAVKRMAAMRRGGATYKEIGTAFGLTGEQVQHGFKALGMRTPPIKRGPRAQFDVARAAEMRRSGMSYEKIAKEFGLSAATVTRAIRENPGLNRSMFAFDIDLAMKMRRAGYGYVAISKAVGASRPTVTNAIELKMLSAPIRLSHPGFNVTRARKMRRRGMSFQAIGEALGVPAHRVVYRLKDFDAEVDPRPAPRFDVNQARRMLRKGASLVEIAEKCGLSLSDIARHLDPRSMKDGGPETASAKSPEESANPET